MRFVSLSAARLWGCIDLCDSRFAHEFLLRSGLAPIRLISTSPPRLYIGDLQAHAIRVESLDVHLFPEDLINLFSSLGPDLGNLTSLSLRVPPVSTNSILDVTAHLPSLRRLALEGVSIPWNLCEGLTHLSLRGLGPGYSPSLTQLRAIFQSSPNLERIRLGCISPSFHLSDPPPHQYLISLPRLREFFIAAKAPIILSILSSISLPSTARLQVNCSQFDGLGALFPSSPGTMYTALDIRAVRLEREGVRLFPSAAQAWLEDPADCVVSFGSAWPISHFLSDVPQFFDLTHVTALELGSMVLFAFPRQLLEHFFEHLPALEDLRVAFNVSLTDLLFVLSTPCVQSDSESTHEERDGHNLLCPHLRTISFGRTRDEGWSPFDEEDEEWLPLLLTLARARHGAGVPLEILEFTRCHGVSPRMCEDFEGLMRWLSVDTGTGRDRG